MMKRLFALLAISTMMTAAQAAEPDTLGYDKFRFGGYGEMVANFKDYGTRKVTPSKTTTRYPFHVSYWPSTISSHRNGFSVRR